MQGKRTDNELISSSGFPDVAPVLELNPEDYREHLDDDLSEEQQNELLHILWDIMRTMVDIGWGVDNVQLVLPELFEDVAQDSAKLLESKDKQEGEG